MVLPRTEKCCALPTDGRGDAAAEDQQYEDAPYHYTGAQLQHKLRVIPGHCTRMMLHLVHMHKRVVSLVQVRSTKHFCIDVILIGILLSIGIVIFRMYKK